MNLNIGIQIQLWRVTTFYKIHCVIDYTFVVIDYQWIVLKKKLRVITLNMLFSKVTTLPMVSLSRHEESIKAWLWHTFKVCDILPDNPFSQSFSNHHPLFFLLHVNNYKSVLFFTRIIIMYNETYYLIKICLKFKSYKMLN